MRQPRRTILERACQTMLSCCETSLVQRGLGITEGMMVNISEYTYMKEVRTASAREGTHHILALPMKKSELKDCMYHLQHYLRDLRVVEQHGGFVSRRATLGIEENMEFQVTSGVLPKLLPWCSVHLVRVLEEKPLGLAGPPT